VEEVMEGRLCEEFLNKWRGEKSAQPMSEELL
jgi:hypothetical protein